MSSSFRHSAASSSDMGPKDNSLLPPDARQTNGGGDGGQDKPSKPTRVLNRVPRACNACRKQKMRCEGAENPPCKRCRHAGYECLFEKPVRDPTTNEQGMERIRNLETSVNSLQNTMNEIVTMLKAGHSIPAPSPRSAHSPSSSSQPHNGPSPQFIPYAAPVHDSPPVPSPIHHPHRGPHYNESSMRDYPYPQTTYRRPSSGDRTVSENGSLHTPQTMSYGQPPYAPMPSSSPAQQQYPPSNHVMAPPSSMGPSLPPLSSLHSAHLPSFQSQPHRPPSHHDPHSPQHPGPVGPSLRGGRFALDPSLAPSVPPHPGSHYLPLSPGRHQGPPIMHHSGPIQGPQSGPLHLRHMPIPSSNVTSADSSDDEGELPTSGLTAPISVLRGLADLAAERGDTGENGTSAEHTRSPSPDPLGSGRERQQGGRAPKRRKTDHPPPTQTPSSLVFPDVVTKEIVTEREARELFEIFYKGCSTFLPVFDKQVDTFDNLHRRSPFCVNAICMVAAKVRDSGGEESETFKRCLDEVQKIACATLFSPVTRQEAIQATIIIAGWSSDGGWLSLGHAVRMAFEISMHRTWPKLLKRIKAGKARDDADERELVISTRTWFCLYLFEHQLSFGTGRPALLHEDESIVEAHVFLQHPLAIPDDMRLVSMVELAIIRERVHNKLSTASGVSPTPPDVYAILASTHEEFQGWSQKWSDEFAKHHHPDFDAKFQTQSLEVQRLFAELFAGATALRGIRGSDDVLGMPPEQRQLAFHSIDIARKGLDLCLRTDKYREGLKYAVHFTHVSATFAASFLIRLARLFPTEVDLRSVVMDVEALAHELSRIPATRYARTLRLMLQRARRRRVLPPRSNPGGMENAQSSVRIEGPPEHENSNVPVTALSHVRSPSDPSQISMSPTVATGGMSIQNASYPTMGFDPNFTGYEMTNEQELPGWLSESNLGDLALSQYGLEAFLIPQQYDETRTAPEIW